MRRALYPIIFGGPNYSAEARALFAAMTTPPTAARKALINNTIVALKNAGIWSKLDILYVLAAADSQAARLNWKNPGTFDAIAVNSPTFDADRGFTGNGTSSRLRTQWAPATNGVNFTQNDASVWGWSLNAINSSGLVLGDTSGVFIRPNNGGNLGGRLNTITTMTGNAIATSVGLSGITRASSTTAKTWKNGVQNGADIANTSAALVSTEQWICGGNGTSFATNQMAFAAWGASLTGLELQFYNIELGYMQGVGAA